MKNIGFVLHLFQRFKKKLLLSSFRMHCINLFFISLLIAQFEKLRLWFRANAKTKQIKKNLKAIFLKTFKQIFNSRANHLQSHNIKP